MAGWLAGIYWHVCSANDPDADRLALAERRPDGSWHIFSGNELGMLLGQYCMEQFIRHGNDQHLGLVLTTVVSSRMLQKMATVYKMHYRDTLTGFKWLAREVLGFIKEHPECSTIFMFEEALVHTVHTTHC